MLAEDGGKACPSVLNWLRRSGWRDSCAVVAVAASRVDWQATRGGVEGMAARCGMCSYDEGVELGKWRLFGEYEDLVRAASVELFDAKEVA